MHGEGGGRPHSVVGTKTRFLRIIVIGIGATGSPDTAVGGAGTLCHKHARRGIGYLHQGKPSTRNFAYTIPGGLLSGADSINVGDWADRAIVGRREAAHDTERAGKGPPSPEAASLLATRPVRPWNGVRSMEPMTVGRAKRQSCFGCCDVIAAFENYTAEILDTELFLATAMLVDRGPECPMVKADVLEGIDAGIMMATARYEVVQGVESV